MEVGPHSQEDDQFRWAVACGLCAAASYREAGEELHRGLGNTTVWSAEVGR
jgi:hypothetical protein